MERKDSPSLSDIPAAEYLGLKPQTLRNWRYLGRGPAYHTLGRAIRYSIADLQRFKDKHRIDPEAAK